MEDEKDKAGSMEKGKEYLMTGLLLVACLAAPQAYIVEGSGIKECMLYHFTHANVFHLLVNFMFLLRYKPLWRSTLFGWITASIVAYMPICAMELPTCGLSGICYAMIARSNAYQKRISWIAVISNIPMSLVGVFNWRLHIMSYLISFISWTVYLRVRNS